MKSSVCYPDDFYEDEKDYFDSKSVTTPDCLIRGSSLDHVDRFIENYSYPFSEIMLKPNKGCYFFFDSYSFEGDVVDFAPLYVGKSTQLNKRPYRHWSSQKNDINKYIQSIIFNTGEFSINLGSDVDENTDKLVPTGDIKVAVWLESNEQELMFFEHELIYKLRPMFNKA